MAKTGVQKLARALRVLVTIVFACNMAALFFVPALPLAYHVTLGGSQSAAALPALPPDWIQKLGPYETVLAAFLLFCGVCTAVILWQARLVLDTIAAQTPFCRKNSVCMKRAAVCCFLISGAALLRLCWGFWFYRSIRPLLTYNALFIPLFLMAGLLCMVMSALFRQAAELKEENDLTI